MLDERDVHRRAGKETGAYQRSEFESMGLLSRFLACKTGQGECSHRPGL